MEDVLPFVLKQIPLVVFMAIVIWQQQKEKNGFKKDLKEANKSHAKERKETNESNVKLLAELTDKVYESDIENIKVLEAIKVHMMKNK
jgi:hypothetical protein